MKPRSEKMKRRDELRDACMRRRARLDAQEYQRHREAEEKITADWILIDRPLRSNPSKAALDAAQAYLDEEDAQS